MNGGNLMRNKFIIEGIIFPVDIMSASSLLLSSLISKNLRIKLIPLIFTFFVSNIYAQYDTIVGFGSSQIMGDPFNAVLIAKKRAIADAVSKYKSKVYTATLLDKKNGIENINEIISSKSELSIKECKEIKTEIVDEKYFKSEIKIIVKNFEKVKKENRIREIKSCLNLANSEDLRLKIRELLKAYKLIKKYEIDEEEINENLIKEKINEVLANIEIKKIQKIDKDLKFEIFSLGKVTRSFDIIKIGEKSNKSGNSYFVTLDLGSQYYELLSLGINIPFIKVNV